MSEEAKNAIIESIGKNKVLACDRAHAISLAYAGSGNANPTSIPKLYADLVHLFSTGEQPAPAAPKTQGQTGY